MTRIGVIPDLHLMSENKQEVLEELESVKTQFKNFQPDIVVLPGDIIQDENSERDREHIGEVRNRLDELGCKIRFLGGNHDCVNLGLSELETEFQNEMWGMETVDGGELDFSRYKPAERRVAGRGY